MWIFVLSLLIAVLAVILHRMWVDGTEFNRRRRLLHSEYNKTTGFP